MSPVWRTALQVGGALLLVAAVLWWMWRLPRDESPAPMWAAWLGLVSPWAGIAAVMTSLLAWWSSAADVLLSASLLALDPLAVGTGVLVLWTQRRGGGVAERVGEDARARGLQRVQACVGIGLGLLAVALGYTYALTHKTPFTPVGL